MKDFTKEDRAQRERLERASPDMARLDRVGGLNKIAAGAAGRELPGLAAYVLMRGMQARGRDIVRRNEKFERMLATGRLDIEVEGERFDRLHPPRR
jgi:hypothetical protein